MCVGAEGRGGSDVGVHLIASATGIPYSLSEAGWLENSPGAKSLTGEKNKRAVMQKGMIRQSAGLRRRSGGVFFFF